MEKKMGLQVKTAFTDNSPYVFHLYVTGASPNSRKAITNLKSFLERNIKDRYELEITDVYQQPQIVKSVDIIALPLLVRKFPLPEKRLIGDMSDYEKLLKTLSAEDFSHGSTWNI